MTTQIIRQTRNSRLQQCLSKAVDVMGNTKYKLKDYQIDGVKWMLDKELNTVYKGGILADDPGLGKTIQCAGLLAGNPLDKTLIIVPTSVISQWISTLAEIMDRDLIYLHHGTSKAKTPMDLMSKNFKVCITSHGSCFTAAPNNSSKSNNVKTILHFLSWDRIIVDEGHVIRNSSTKIHKACCQYTNLINKKWILTGTPVQNSIKDMINILKFVGIRNSVIRKNLDSIVDKYVLRRTKNILMTYSTFENYEIINNIVTFDTKEEQNIYEEIQNNALEDLLTAEEELDGASLNLFILELLLRLRQASSHPGIALESLRKKYDDYKLEKTFSLNRESSKMKKVIKDIQRSSGYCLVFCHFQAEMNLLQSFLDNKGILSEIYNGSLSRSQRDDVIDKFDSEPVKKKVFKDGDKFKIRENKPRVLIIQIKAGGVGLNLQQFNNVFILSPDWNPANEIQAISRAHRLGQTRHVNVNKYTLVYNDEFLEENNMEDMNGLDGKESETTNVSNNPKNTSVDERILGIQLKKREIMVQILNDPTLKFKEHCSINGKVTMGDLKFMVGK
jgi:SNF2 family DNA or RNA helicase